MVDDKIVGGQTNVQLNQKRASIDITNKIKSDWAEALPGLKTWSIKCNGVYVIDNEGYNALEKSFLDNTEVKVIMKIGEKRLTGNALITDFPLSSGFNTQFKYSIDLLGNGALDRL